jgi:S-(hydroxymethyl)glutathione dehydrogenase/alcohol dehydrogenase
MTQMKVAFFDGLSAMTLADVSTPEPGPGDAIIRVRATGICGFDLLMNVDKTEPDPVPFGHAVADEIERSGFTKPRNVETSGPHASFRNCW